MDINFVSPGGQKKGSAKSNDGEYQIVWSRPQAEKKSEPAKEKPNPRPVFSFRKKALEYWHSLKALIPEKKPRNILEGEVKKKFFAKKEEIVMKNAPKVEAVDVPHINLINGRHKAVKPKSPFAVIKKTLPKPEVKPEIKKELPKTPPKAVSHVKPSTPAPVLPPISPKPVHLAVKKPEHKKPSLFWSNLHLKISKILALFPLKPKITKQKEVEKPKEKINQATVFTQGKTVTNPEVLRANLLTREISGFLKWGQELLLPSLLVLVPFIVITVAYISILSLAGQAKADLETDNAKLTETESTLIVLEKNSAPALAFREKIKNAGLLLDNHIYWTNFFDFLEKNTLKDVGYQDNFQGNLQGKFQFSAKTKNLELIKEQVKVLQNNPLVISAKALTAKTGSADQEEPSFDFDLSFEIKPEIWQR